ncbi:MAG: hypothetical protein AVDCRST_MAG48-850, partial [uncultured Friedmanniella sp.]
DVKILSVRLQETADEREQFRGPGHVARRGRVLRDLPA